jgi:hypothetical protein
MRVSKKGIFVGTEWSADGPSNRFHTSTRSIFLKNENNRSQSKNGVFSIVQAKRIIHLSNEQFLPANRTFYARKFTVGLIRQGLQPETLCYGDSESIRPQSVQTVSTRMRWDAQ